MSFYDRLAACPEGPAPHPYPPPAPPDAPPHCPWVACVGSEAVAAGTDLPQLIGELSAALEEDTVVWHQAPGSDPWSPAWRLAALLRPLAGGKVNLLWL